MMYYRGFWLKRPNIGGLFLELLPTVKFMQRCIQEGLSRGTTSRGNSNVKEARMLDRKFKLNPKKTNLSVTQAFYTPER